MRLFLNGPNHQRSPHRAASRPNLYRLLFLVASVSAAPLQAQAPATPSPATATPSAISIPRTTFPTGQITPTTSNAPTPKTADDSTSQRTNSQEPAQQTVTPDAPTDFQRLVAETTGTQLPIFGASLFNGVPSTFAPVDNIPVSPTYLLGPGDEIRVQLYGQVNQQGAFTIDRNGDIAFPEVGTIHLAGLPYSQLQAFLRSQLGRVYRNFDLNVNMGQLRSIQVFVVGQARRPGSYTISSLSTLLNALFASGGPLPTGSLRDIQVSRQGAVLTHFDLYDLLLHGDKSKDIPLAPGDTIFIPVVGPQVAVSGSVNVPAVYEIKPGTTVEQTIALAGGNSAVALGAQVRLDRIFEHTMRSIVDVNIAQGQNPSVQDGDILTVAAISDRYKDAVTLRGNVEYPGRYVWHAGMKLTDLVPSKDQLITRDFYRRRNALGNAIPSTAGQAGLQINGSGSTQSTDQAILNGTAAATGTGANSLGAALTSGNSVFAAATDVVLSAPDIDWSYAVVERLDPATLKTSLIEFSPGKLFLENDQTQNLPLQSGDVITFFSTADIKVPTRQQTRFVRLEGEFNSPGVYSVQPGDTLRSLVARAGGLTPDSYLYGSDFTRESTRRIQQQRLNEYADSLESRLSIESANRASTAISANDAAASAAGIANGREIVARLRRSVALGRIVLEVKPDSNGMDNIPELALEDGDRFVIPRVPATVSVEGQVYSASAFLFQPDHRERDYLRQAGGPDRQADPKRTFILHADGSVSSDQYGNVSKAPIHPGDTIIVPPKLQHPSIFRDLVDISAIVGQFGLLAAVLSVR
jgi:polysaccharide export outer membrane protein